MESKNIEKFGDIVRKPIIIGGFTLSFILSMKAQEKTAQVDTVLSDSIKIENIESEGNEKKLKTIIEENNRYLKLKELLLEYDMKNIPSLPAKRELFEVKKMLKTLEQGRDLKFLRDTVISIYNETLKHLESEEYQKKLQIEFGDSIMSMAHRDYRINRFKKVKIYFEFNTNGFSRYDIDKNIIILQIDDLIKSPTLESVSHEMTHNINQIGFELSDRADSLYKKAWIGNEQFTVIQLKYPYLFKSSDNLYFKSHTEMDSRKRVLEIYMEKTGMKKYGEKMTSEHYKKLMKLLQDGELDRNCTQILLTCKKEELIEIMNIIASNEYSEFRQKYIYFWIKNNFRNEKTHYGLISPYYNGEIISINLTS